jgi:predicted HTH domain antitoxin
MKVTLSLSDQLVAELDELLSFNGHYDRNRLIQKLLRESVAGQKQRHVAHLYRDGKKTLRQCAEILGVDLREMMDILRRLNIPLDGGRFPHNKLALKLLRQGAKTRSLHSSN